jgi:thiol:disulfide interchange protein DsbC
MRNRLLHIFLFFFLFILPLASHAFEERGQDCSKCHKLNNDEAKDLLKEMFPDLKVFSVSPAPSKALWEVYIESRGRKGVVYVDFSKRHMFSGAMVSIKEKKNLTQERLTELNRVDVSQIPLGDALVMGDEKARIRIIDFTDPD